MDYKQLTQIGGLLAFTGAFLILLPLTLDTFQIDPYFFGYSANTAVQWLLNAYIMVLTLTGALLGLLSKRIGGVLAVVAGGVALILPLLAILLNDPDVALMFTQYSTFWGYSFSIAGFNLVVFETVVGSTAIYITIESVLILAGGVLILMGKSKDDS